LQKEEANRYFLNHNNLPRLEEQQKLEMESEINIEDIAKAIMAMQAPFSNLPEAYSREAPFQRISSF
jgi:hypothetical protein